MIYLTYYSQFSRKICSVLKLGANLLQRLRLLRGNVQYSYLDRYEQPPSSGWKREHLNCAKEEEPEGMRPTEWKTYRLKRARCRE